MKTIKNVFKSFIVACVAVNQFWNPGEYTVVRLFGKPFTFPGGRMKVFTLMFWEIVENNQYHIELIKDGSIVIDAGANMGVFSVLVASKYPNAIIYAFEPTPETFSILKKNAEQYPNIKVFNSALGDTEGNSSIVCVPDNPEGNFIVRKGFAGDRGFLRGIYRYFKRVTCQTPVEMKTIDGLGITVDFLKMDTEGRLSQCPLTIIQTTKTTSRIYSKPSILNTSVS